MTATKIIEEKPALKRLRKLSKEPIVDESEGSVYEDPKVMPVPRPSLTKKKQSSRRGATTSKSNEPYRFIRDRSCSTSKENRDQLYYNQYTSKYERLE